MEVLLHFWDTLISSLGFLIDVVLHLDRYINLWVDAFGIWIYILVFFVILCETGCILTPFLPGDSLLFALGALTATTDAKLNFWILWPLLLVAAIFGAAMNYSFGKWISPRLIAGKFAWINANHLKKTEEFYRRHGGKTIVVARFIPIIRTYAPFVAGIGGMDYRQFSFYNIVGGVAWVPVILVIGRYFGNLPVIKENFGLVVPAIIIVSVIPIFYEFIVSRFRRSAKSREDLQPCEVAERD